MWFVAVLIFVLLLVLLAYRDTKKPRNLPPGPTWLPILGSYLEFKKLTKKFKFFHLMLDEFYRIHGPVVAVRVMRAMLIFVSGKDAVQEGLLREEFDGRQTSFMVKHRTMGVRRGIIFTDGEEWKEQRRFVLRKLRDLGFGKRTMESMIREEALELLSRLSEMGKKAGREGVDMEKVYTIPVLSSLWTMMSGQRCSQDDENLQKFTGLVTTLSRSMATSGIIRSFPWMRFFLPRFKKYDALRKELWNYFAGTVEEHRETKTDGDPRDLIDTYLDEMKKREGDKSSFSEGQLIALCDDLFAAGTETTSNTLAFGVLFLLHHPDVQVKIHEELDRVVGRDRFPTIEDKPNLPYLNAVLLEIRRCCDVVPMSVPHRCIKDTEFRGYILPKGSSVIFNIRSVHMDPEYWIDPLIFRPERFLIPGTDGGPMKLKDEPSWLIPFGLGQRRCLGEPLARTSLYIFFSVISHGLRFTNPPGCALPSTEGVGGFVHGTGPLKAVVEARF